MEKNHGQLEDFLPTSGSQGLSKSLVNLLERERKQLANEMHDSFLQDLVLLKWKIESVRKMDDLDQVKKQLTEAEGGTLDIINLIRELCQGLYPPLLIDMRLEPALNELVNKVHLHANIDLNLYIDEQIIKGKLDIDLVLALYRIIQELLTNAIKHSKANQLNIELFFSGSGIELLYEDDGIGLETSELSQNTKQLGIRGIKERVYCFNGITRLVSDDNDGLQVNIYIPYSVENRR